MGGKTELELNEWHTITISRRRRNCTLKVNNEEEVFANSGGRFQGLDLGGPFYLGGLPSFEAQLTKKSQY